MLYKGRIPKSQGPKHIPLQRPVGEQRVGKQLPMKVRITWNTKSYFLCKQFGFSLC